MFFGGDPFAEHFAGGVGRRGRPSANVDTTKLYETLEVEKDADAKAIKKAYRKMAIKHHPDKGGDEHTFKEVNAGKFFFHVFFDKHSEVMGMMVRKKSRAQLTTFYLFFPSCSFISFE